MLSFLKFWSGGRPIANDDLKALQGQSQSIISMFAGNGPVILQGCTISPNGTKFDVSAGLVMIDNQLRTFAGAVNVDLPIELIADVDVESDPREEQGGTIHNAMIEYKATWQYPTGAGSGGGGIG